MLLHRIGVFSTDRLGERVTYIDIQSDFKLGCCKVINVPERAHIFLFMFVSGFFSFQNFMTS